MYYRIVGYTTESISLSLHKEFWKESKRHLKHQRSWWIGMPGYSNTFRDSIVKLVFWAMILKIVGASKEKNSVEMQISSMLNLLIHCTLSSESYLLRCTGNKKYLGYLHNLKHPVHKLFIGHGQMNVSYFIIIFCVKGCIAYKKYFNGNWISVAFLNRTKINDNYVALMYVFSCSEILKKIYLI